MSIKVSRIVSMIGAIALLLGIPCAARAQADQKPVAVISINKMDEIMGDLGLLTEVAGQQDAGRVFLGMAGIYSSGIDRTKPAGAYVTIGQAGPQVVAFVPVKNLKQLLGVYREQLGTPKDIGNGVLEIGADRPQPVYVKEQGGWAYLVQDPKNFAGLPADPSKMLQGLDQKYDIAIQFNMANIPAEIRDLFISQMKMGYDQAMEAQSRNLPPDQREIADQLGKTIVKGVEEFVEQAEQLTLGFAIDGKTKNMSLEVALTAKPGTDLAKQMATMYDIKSLFGGLGGKDSAANGNMTMALAPNDIAQLNGLLKAAREGAMKGIDDDSGVPAGKRDSLKSAVSSILDVLQSTASAGKIDAGGAVNLGDEGAEVVAGALLQDGLKLEKAVKELVAIGKDEPNFPNIQLDVAKHGGVNFHKIEIPTAELDANARKVFGDRLELVLGFGRDRALFAMGRDGQAILKRAIDRGAAGAAALPLQVQLATGQWIRFANKLESNPQNQTLAAASEKVSGSDKVSLMVKPIERGMAYRFEIASGVIE
ncbi:MAG: hypothetical protein EHM77_03895, partial [Planctomycetaceae bacterium]